MPWTTRLGSRLKLRDLNIFMTVAIAGTMGRAAAELAVSQPVISKAVADLEHALGVRLFDRSRRGVELTGHGRSLRDSGVALFDELRQGVERLEALSDPTTGEVRIGTTEPLATGLVSAAINLMAARYPRMKFYLVQTDIDTLRTRDLRARNIDFAFARILQPINDDEFAVEVLFNEPLVVVAGRTSKWARRRNVRLADLVKERWALPPLDLILAALRGAFAAAGLELPRPNVLTLSVHVIGNVLATGKFLSAIAPSTFGWGTDYLPFKALPIDLPTTVSPVAVVTLRGRTMSAAANLFVDCLRELVSKRERKASR